MLLLKKYINMTGLIRFKEKLDDILDTKADADDLDDLESKGKITINNTEYEVRTSTTDAGQSGYITFVVEE